ncbi:hypothetical protein JCM11251_004391 [Rhodosporidiobolus azoricus]
MTGAKPSVERQPLLSHSQHVAASPAYASLTRQSPPLKANKALPSVPARAPPAAGGSRSTLNDAEAAATAADSEADSDSDADETASASSSTPLSPSERRKKLLRFLLTWAVVVGVVVYLVVEAFHRGGGQFDWRGALKKAAGGGISGALAMVIQVLALMPLRTVMNHQYRYGGTTTESTKKLYEEGGPKRYYAGLGPALIQGPVARFGDTAANAGVLALLSSNPFLSKLPSPLKTAFASVLGALFRMVLMPVDTLKTTMQTQGSSSALVILKERVKTYGPGTLWAGAWATAAANFVGSFPWFATYNFLQSKLPRPPPLDSPSPSHPYWQLLLLTLLRQALIGFLSSVVSDTISNSLRVIKTYRQVSRRKVGYRKAARTIWRKEGAKGLFGRGLKTRLLANGLQGLLFSVLWKAIGEALEKRGKK